MSYKTIRNRTEASFTEKKSEFIGYISPAGTEEEAIGFINEIRAMHRKAEEKAKAMVSEEVITKQAQNRAHEILTSAQTKSKEIKSATNKYVESMLSRVDELLTSNLTDVRKTRASLKDSKN